MYRPLRITGLILASLTVVTVALAQQSGSQGRMTMPPQSATLLAIALPEDGKARLSRPSEPRRARTDCQAETCETPPKSGQSAQANARTSDGCGLVAHDRNGKIIRRICQF
ncbi:MAG: hypothetical protein DCF30_12670 [Hyphomicrobiales bacterium]|nr:MAG: hypothetical protein DCF30_12670 [Hyphomicrobiales bacterium]